MRQGEDRRVMKTLDLDRKIKKLSDSYFTLWQTKKVSLPCVLVVASISSLCDKYLSQFATENRN